MPRPGSFRLRTRAPAPEFHSLKRLNLFLIPNLERAGYSNAKKDWGAACEVEGEQIVKVLKPFRGRVLESVLIIAAVAVAVTAVTVVANLLTLNARFAEMTGGMLHARQLALKPKADDYEAFYQGVVSVDAREIGPKESETPELALTDLEAVKAAAPSVAYAYIEDFWSFDHQALEGSSLWASKVTADFQEAVKLDVSEGSLMSASDFRERNRVMLISPEAIKKLKLKAPFVGQKVTFENEEGTYTIVGVLKLTDAPDDDDYYEVFVPWTPSEWNGIQQLTLSTETAADMLQAQSEVRAYADKTWGETMVVRSSLDSTRALLQVQRVRTLIIAVFATLGLVTAALSIMSLMLARVLRRGREIGVRRSLGATRSAIRNQFLGEALTLGALGGALGVALGYGVNTLYRNYMEGLYEGSGDFLTFSPPAALGAFGVALGVSLLFGLFPAVMASRVRIVDSLKEA